jgi:hypothetical protein
MSKLNIEFGETQAWSIPVTMREWTNELPGKIRRKYLLAGMFGSLFLKGKKEHTPLPIPEHEVNTSGGRGLRREILINFLDSAEESLQFLDETCPAFTSLPLAKALGIIRLDDEKVEA